MWAKVKLQVKQKTTVYYQFGQHLHLSGILLFSRPQKRIQSREKLMKLISFKSSR